MADVTDLQKLVVSLEARTSQFERALAKANRTATVQTKAIESRFQKMNAGISAGFAGIGKGLGFLGISTAVFSLGALASEAKRIVEWSDDMADLGQQTGIAVEQLQALQMLAEDTGASAETMSKGLKFFTRELGEASTKTNDLSRLLELNGIAIRDQTGNLRPAADVFRDLINLIGRFETESERAKAAAIAFGAANSTLGETFEDGAIGLDKMAEAGARAGTIHSQEEIDRLAQYKDAMAQLSRVLEGLKFGAVIALAEAIGFLAENFRTLAAVLSAITGNPGAMLLLTGEITAGGVDKTAASYDELNRQLEITNREYDELANAPAPTGVDAETAQNAEIAKQERMNELLQQRADIEYDLNHVLEERKDIATEKLREQLTAPPPGTVPATGPTDTQVPAEEVDFGGRFDSGSTTAPPPPTAPPPVLPPDPGEANEAAAAAERQAEAIARVSEQLQFERDQLTRTAREQEIYNALHQAGVDINSEAGQQIAELAGMLYDEQKALEAVIENMDLLRTSAKDFTTTLITGLAEGKEATEVLGDALKRLADRLISSGIDQLFDILLGMPGTPGFLGAVFGRATGGQMNPGSAYRMHEGEIVMPRSPLQAIPASKLGGGGDSLALSYAPSIVIQGNADENAIRVMRDRMLIDIEQRLPSMVRKAHSNRTL